MSRILNFVVVEDDQVDAINITRSLRKAGVSNAITIADDGVEALRMLRDGTVPKVDRLIILDIDLPKMNGFEFLRELRSDASLATIPVVILTSSAEETARAKAFQLNVAGYLVKPVTDDAVATLRQYWTLVQMPR